MRSIFRPIACSLALLLAPTSAAAERLTLSPTGHVLTPVMVNGAGPFDFVVDTAASASALYPAVRGQLGLQPLDGHRAAVHGASGRQTISIFRLDRVEVAGQVSGPLNVAGLEAVGAAADGAILGLIGVDVLFGRVAEFDVPGGRFLLHDGATDLAASGHWRALPFTLNRVRFPTLAGALDGRPIEILFDTGARRTVINWAAARQLGIAPGDPGLEPDEPLRGATDHQTIAVRRGFGTLEMVGFPLSPANITIADLPVFAQLGWADRPAMILGIDRMRGYRFAVDYPRNRLLIATPPQAAAR